MATLEELLALLPDNSVGAIDAADLRTIVTDLFTRDSTLAAATASNGGQIASNTEQIEGRLSEDELSASFAGASRGTLTGFWGFLGDSITYGTAATVAGGFVSYVSRFSGQRIRLAVRAGYQGYRSDQLLSAVASDIVPSGATTCFVLAGTNDASQDVPLATYASNMTAIFAAVRAAGIAPVAGLVPPRSDKASLISQYNSWLRSYCQESGIPVADTFTPLVSQTTGGLASAYDYDGVHPTLAGHQVMAQAIVDAVEPFVPSAVSMLSTSNLDASNMFTNGLMLTDATADGLADGWATTGTATPTYELTTDVAWKGKAQRVALPGGSLYRRLQQTITTGFSPGDVIGFGAVVKIANGGPNTSGFKLDIDYPGTATVPLASGMTEDATMTIWETFTVREGATQFVPRFVCQQSGSAVDYYIAQATLKNLTSLGIA